MDNVVLLRRFYQSLKLTILSIEFDFIHLFSKCLLFLMTCKKQVKFTLSKQFFTNDLKKKYLLRSFFFLSSIVHLVLIVQKSFPIFT